MAAETGLLCRYFSSLEAVEQVSARSRESVFTSSDRFLGFKRKMILWKNRVVK
jgi:hypothetical protein